MNKFILAVATLVGTIIGAGILGIPYVFSKSGMLLGMVNLVFIGAAVLVMNLMLGEVTLRTKRPHMLPQLAKQYLGKKGEFLMFASMFIGIWGALVAYMIGIGEALAALVGPEILGINSNLFFSLAIFVVGSLLIYYGLQIVVKVGALLSVSMLAVLFTLGIFALSKASLANLTSINLANIALPYGVVLFAMLGTSSIPEMRVILDKDLRKMKLAILLGTIIPIIVYLLFALYVVGVTGVNTTQLATIGLGQSLGTYALYLANIFATCSMAGSFIILGIALKDSLRDSFGMRKVYAFLLTVSVPLIIFIFMKDFIQVMDVSGSLTGGITGILIALMWMKGRKVRWRRPEFAMRGKFLPYLVIFVFGAGMIYTLINLFL